MVVPCLDGLLWLLRLLRLLAEADGVHEFEQERDGRDEDELMGVCGGV